MPTVACQKTEFALPRFSLLPPLTSSGSLPPTVIRLVSCTRCEGPSLRTKHTWGKGVRGARGESGDVEGMGEKKMMRGQS